MTKKVSRTVISLVAAALIAGPLAAAASADPVIQPLRCRIGDKTGVYVGGKCSGPY